jgi:hypothetical protein
MAPNTTGWAYLSQMDTQFQGYLHGDHNVEFGFHRSQLTRLERNPEFPVRMSSETLQQGDGLAAL